MKQETAAKLRIVISMVIFGTIGVFVRNMTLPSSLIALVRGVIGVMFLSTVLLVKKIKPDWRAVRKNLLWLSLSGGALGFNWILLFQAYHHTSVAVATLCYYTAPVFVILFSMLLLRERLTVKRVFCVVLALLGTACISGVSQEISSSDELKGILLGVAAAVLYASIVLMNKRISDISPYDKTIVQLGISAVVLLPYCLATLDITAFTLNLSTVWMLLLVGIVHTGLAYLLYFSAISHVEGQSAAMISYLDPVVAVLSSVLILKEPLFIWQAAGAVLVLFAAILSEYTFGKKVNP